MKYSSLSLIDEYKLLNLIASCSGLQSCFMFHDRTMAVVTSTWGPSPQCSGDFADVIFKKASNHSEETYLWLCGTPHLLSESWYTLFFSGKSIQCVQSSMQSTCLPSLQALAFTYGIYCIYIDILVHMYLYIYHIYLYIYIYIYLYSKQSVGHLKCCSFLYPQSFQASLGIPHAMGISLGRSLMKRPTLRMPCIGFTSYRMGKGRLADWVRLSWFLSRCFTRNWSEALTKSYDHWWTSKCFAYS